MRRGLRNIYLFFFGLNIDFNIWQCALYMYEFVMHQSFVTMPPPTATWKGGGSWANVRGIYFFIVSAVQGK